MTVEARLAELGIVLPFVPASSGSFLPHRFAGPLLFLSGQTARDESGMRLTGIVPTAVSVEEAYRRARLTGLQLLANAQAALGSLDRVEAVVKVFGMVYATLDFKDHPTVINGCSDLFEDVLGPAGRHARSAVGMGSLPHGISVEIEAILLVRPDA
ncbi:MAG TPA: RidA family protein [Devosia sp.]|nr:RidA family protein [Devosia sp.]